MQVSGILRGRKNISDVLLLPADNTPIPVCQELACRTINHSISHYGLVCIHLSNSCESKGVGLCLPQNTPNLMLCCLKRAQHYPVFLLIHSFLYCALFILERSDQCYQKDTTRKLVNFYVSGSED